MADVAKVVAGRRGGVVPLLVSVLLAGACDSAPASGGRVQVTLTADGSFGPERMARLVLSVDGDGGSRVVVEVPLPSRFPAAGITTAYAPRTAGALVLGAVALDARGARVASALSPPLRPGADSLAVTLVLSSAGPVDAGVAGLPPG